MGEKAVIDTNVIISGLFWGGSPGLVLDLLLDGQIQMVISVMQLLELRRVLSREKFGFSEELQDKALAVIADMSLVLTLTHVPAVISADASDDVILATAVQFGANYIITGDAHLLSLGQHQGVRILTPSAFISYLRTRTHRD